MKQLKKIMKPLHTFQAETESLHTLILKAFQVTNEQEITIQPSKTKNLTIHAEANAIIQAAKNGVCIDNAELYTTASPCWNCFKMIANAGIKKICYGEFYRDERSIRVAKEIGLELIKVELEG